MYRHVCKFWCVIFCPEPQHRGEQGLEGRDHVGGPMGRVVADEVEGPVRSEGGNQASPSLVALLVQSYSSNAASLVLCALRRVKDHCNLPHDSPRLKKSCVRQVVLDKWLPPRSCS